MCLDTVDKKTRTNVEYGYKVFYIWDKKLLGEFYQADGKFHGNSVYKKRKWYKSSDTIIGKLTYSSGFHVFTNKRDAIKYIAGNSYKVFKVKIKNIVASGTQDSYGAQIDKKVVVAKEMMILEEVK